MTNALEYFDCARQHAGQIGLGVFVFAMFLLFIKLNSEIYETSKRAAGAIKDPFEMQRTVTWSFLKNLQERDPKHVAVVTIFIFLFVFMRFIVPIVYLN